MVAVILSEGGTDDPCAWYFVNIAVEVTAGVLLSYCLLKLTNFICRRLGLYSVVSGNYVVEENNEIDLASWAVQLMVWGSIVAVVALI